MANKENASIESGSDQLNVVKEQPSPKTSIVHSGDQNQSKEKDTIPKCFDGWFCWIFLCAGEQPVSDNPSSNESENAADSQGYPIKPLKNLGNTCYLNAIIQCLNQTTGVHDRMFGSDERVYDLNNEHLSTVTVCKYDGSITKELMNLFGRIKTDFHINPRPLLDAINQEAEFKIGTQQDSQEVMRFLLQKLRAEEIQCIKEEIHNQRNADSSFLSDESMDEVLQSVGKCITNVEKVFGGVFVTTVICRDCLIPLQLDEPFFDLQLSIPDQQEATGQSSSVMVPQKKLNEPSNILRMRATSPASDGGDIHLATSDSEQYFTDTSQCPYKDAVSSPAIMATASQEQLFTPCVNPSNFASLQRYLDREGMNACSTDLVNLSTKDDLERSLKDFISIDILSKDNKFSCNACRAKMPDTYEGSLVNRQVLIKQLPHVLVLNIKRFIIGSSSVYKNTKHLSFPHVLNMAPYCTNKCAMGMKDRNGRIMYGLYSVVVHNGDTLRGGHYVAYVKKRPTRQQHALSAASDWEYDLSAATADDSWYYTSDQNIRRCSRGFADVHRNNAYLLFYELLPKSSYVHSL